MNWYPKSAQNRNGTTFAPPIVSEDQFTRYIFINSGMIIGVLGKELNQLVVGVVNVSFFLYSCQVSYYYHSSNYDNTNDLLSSNLSKLAFS